MTYATIYPSIIQLFAGDGGLFQCPPYLTDECAEALKDELMLTIWPMENGFIFTFDDCQEFVEVPDSEYPLSAERAKWYLNNMKPWTQEIEDMWFEAQID